MRRALCVLGLAAVAVAGLSASASAAYVRPCSDGVGVEAGGGMAGLGDNEWHVEACF